MVSFLTNIAYFIGLILYGPVIIYRMIAQKRYRCGWAQRLGKISRKYPDKKCIWIHAVSVGEVNATRTLIDGLKTALPDYEIVISSTTDTGLARACTLYDKQHSVFYFPFDLSWIMKKAFDNLHPDIILLMELEVWPNLASLAQQHKVPVVVVNGRISDKSFPKYLKIRKLIAPMFHKVSLVLPQTQEYATRFIALGCNPERVIVTSSLKYDTAQTDGVVAGAERLAEQIRLGADRLWTLGGTGPGEEQIALEVFSRLKKEAPFEDLRLAIVPRKPERFNEVADLIDQSGFTFIRYSRLKEHNGTADIKPVIILGDTMGDLKKFYGLSALVFVGRTLCPMGGSDMMEPAALGKCTMFGPHTFNFKQTVEVLLEGNGALEVQDAEQLYDITRKCLTNPDFAAAIAAAGQKIIRQNQGATLKSVNAIVSLVK
ncbi:MAG TPA: 3-deoxy-D-manno-octulosonic acid transferase [Anaerohalosphaeraceae bacterium]|nr:3-deoxy-D-manno-octulosonic acid transferase [Anaerohalosphaeraceae bacterium]